MKNVNHAEKAKQLFFEGYNCAQAVLCAFSDVVSGAALVLGIVKGYSDPLDNEAKKQHYALVREFAEKFKEKNGSINCGELLTMASLKAETGGTPEERSKEYYQKRPCPELVYDAALILDEMLS